MGNFTTPVGRLVAGSVYTANTKDWQGNPLVTKTGANAGQPRTEYFFALAIAKGQEQHWSQTEWGTEIYNAGLSGFPNGETQRPDFAWKITDGDSQVPNKNGKTPASKEGYAGHWVLSFSSGFAPQLYTLVNLAAPEQLVQADTIRTGYFVQVNGGVEPNGNPGNPGVYMNHSMVCLIGYGEEITVGPDVTTAGFGGGAVPVGMTAAPVGGFNPAVPAPGMQQQPMQQQPMQQQPMQQQPMQQQPMQQQPMQQQPMVPNLPAGQPQTMPVAGVPAAQAVAAPGAIPGMPAAVQYAAPATTAPVASPAGVAHGAAPMTPGYLAGSQ